MPKGMGYPAPKKRTPRQNSEGAAVAAGQTTKTGVPEEFLDTHTDSSLNAKKQSPYGPQFPALARYFRKM